MKNKKLLFLTLNVFSLTGGIEKLSRIVGKALFEISIDNNFFLKVYAMHDFEKDCDEKYFPNSIYKAYNKNKVSFFFNSLYEGLKSDVIILSHVNLLIVGILIKLFSPRVKLYLYAHGIEIWKPLSFWKHFFINKVDKIICVSSFTRDKIVEIHNVSFKKLIVINNCLDPFLTRNADKYRCQKLKAKYGFKDRDIVLLTLSRLSAHDRDKGYEKVLLAMSQLLPFFPNLKYIIGGKYDLVEKKWLDSLINEMNMQSAVKFSGFIPEEELSVYFSSADIYIMPSIKEGFGIIFIEALYFGLPVIAGNRDGSVDALAKGKFGLLVDPYNQTDITSGLKKVLINKENFIPDKEQVLAHFSFSTYKRHLLELIKMST